MPRPSRRRDPRSSTRAVERALALLATVCTQDVTSLAAASRRTGVPASTALRLLRTMEREHFVVRDDEAGLAARARGCSSSPSARWPASRSPAWPAPRWPG